MNGNDILVEPIQRFHPTGSAAARIIETTLKKKSTMLKRNGHRRLSVKELAYQQMLEEQEIKSDERSS